MHMTELNVEDVAEKIPNLLDDLVERVTDDNLRNKEDSDGAPLWGASRSIGMRPAYPTLFRFCA